jgi:hypothetical protein
MKCVQEDVSAFDVSLDVITTLCGIFQDREYPCVKSLAFCPDSCWGRLFRAAMALPTRLVVSAETPLISEMILPR